MRNPFKCKKHKLRLSEHREDGSKNKKNDNLAVMSSNNVSQSSNTNFLASYTSFSSNYNISETEIHHLKNGRTVTSRGINTDNDFTCCCMRGHRTLPSNELCKDTESSIMSKKCSKEVLALSNGLVLNELQNMGENSVAKKLKPIVSDEYTDLKGKCVKDLILAFYKLKKASNLSIDSAAGFDQPNTESNATINNDLSLIPYVVTSIEKSKDNIFSRTNQNINYLDFELENYCKESNKVSEMPLKAKNTKKMWTIEEDKRLIQTLFKISGLEPNEITSKVVRDHGDIITQEFNRVLSSIVGRWRSYLLPIILSSLHRKLNVNVSML